MALVPKFNAKGIAPFSLGGQSRWTNMMWLEFLFDRIGGGEVFQAVFDGQKDAWSNPAAIDALTKMQALIKANGFIKGFSSITADSNADQALLYTGKAAMMLHGTWTYGSMASDGGNFVSGGNLGYMSFPPVEGGKGDPSDTVGNPGQYLSISSKATDAQKEVAKKFFSTAVLSDAEAKEWIDTGSVPILKGTDSQLAASKDAAWLKFVYDTSSKAKTFAQSWDQALSPTAAEALLDNIAKLFQLSISPTQFATNLNGVIGQ
jgi:raffinose/stachyose/melibiose transport system substrate-binding protein